MSGFWIVIDRSRIRLTFRANIVIADAGRDGEELGTAGLLDHAGLQWRAHDAVQPRFTGVGGVFDDGVVDACVDQEFLAVTPGIRFADAAADDQVRITTPARAREIGSDYIVVGRPITAAADPRTAWLRCLREFCPETL